MIEPHLVIEKRIERIERILLMQFKVLPPVVQLLIPKEIHEELKNIREEHQKHAGE